MQIDQIDPELVVANATEPSGNAASAPAVAAGAALLPQIDLFHVVLTVIWGDGSHERQAQFSTLRTAMADPNHPGGISGTDPSAGRRNRGMSTDRAGPSRDPGRGSRR